MSDDLTMKVSTGQVQTGAVQNEEPAKKKVSAYGNLGIGTALAGTSDGEKILVAGSNLGLGLNFTPNDGKTNISAGAESIFGQGYQFKGQIGVEQSINDNLSIGLTGYHERMKSGTVPSVLGPSYQKPKNTTGLDATLKYKPNEHITLTGGIGAKYTPTPTPTQISTELTEVVSSGAGAEVKNQAPNGEINVLTSDKFVRTEVEPIVIKNEILSLGKDAKLSPNLSAGVKINPTKK
mgnify:CR=1 FL=1